MHDMFGVVREWTPDHINLHNYGILKQLICLLLSSIYDYAAYANTPFLAYIIGFIFILYKVYVALPHIGYDYFFNLLMTNLFFINTYSHIHKLYDTIYINDMISLYTFEEYI